MDNIGTLLIVQSHTGMNAGGRNFESNKPARNGKSLAKENGGTFNPYIRYPFKHFLASKQASVSRKRNDYEHSKEQRAKSAANSGQRHRVKVADERSAGFSEPPRARSAFVRRQESAASGLSSEIAISDLVDGVQQMMLRPQDNTERNTNNSNSSGVRSSRSASAVPTFNPSVVLTDSVEGSRRAETGVWGMGHARYAVPSGLPQFRHGPVEKISSSYRGHGDGHSKQSHDRARSVNSSYARDVAAQEDDMRRFTGSMSAASRTFNRRPKTSAANADSGRWLSSSSPQAAAVDSDSRAITWSAVSRQRKLPLVVELDKGCMDWWLSSADVPSQQSLEEAFTARSKPLEVRVVPDSSRKYDGHESVKLRQKRERPNSSRIIHRSGQESKRATSRAKSAVTFSTKLTDDSSPRDYTDGDNLRQDKEEMQLKDVQHEVDKCLVELRARDRHGDDGTQGDTLVVYSYSQVDDDDDTAGGRIDSYEVGTTQNTDNNTQTNVTGLSRSLPTSLSTLHSINVSPLPGLVYYFAFGADINAEWLRQTIGIGPESAGWAVLYGLRLSYVEMPETGNTRVSLVSDSRAAVQGFVYLLRPDELKSLDGNFTTIAKEPMKRVVLPVWLLQSDGGDEETVADGTFYTEYCVPAVCYI